VRAGLRRATSALYRAEFAPGDVLAPAVEWARLDYSTLRERDLSRTVRLRVERAGEAHGVALWFDAEMAEGVQMSNAPGNPPMLYANAFLPWPAALALQPGDRIDVDIGAKLLAGRYLWR